MSYEQLDTKAKIKAYTRDILARLGECKDLQEQHPSEYDYFIEFLFPRHPKYPQKFLDVKSVGIRKNPSYRHLEVYLVYNDGKIDGVSVLKNCASGRQTKDDLTIAMRFSVAPQIKAFRKSAVQKCELCGATTEGIKCGTTTEGIKRGCSLNDLQVDHENPLFIELKDSFLSETKLPIPTEFRSKKDNTKTFTEADWAFRASWQDYHRTHAKLRMLCGPCNLGRNKK